MCQLNFNTDKVDYDNHTLRKTYVYLSKSAYIERLIFDDINMKQMILAIGKSGASLVYIQLKPNLENGRYVENEFKLPGPPKGKHTIGTLEDEEPILTIFEEEGERFLKTKETAPADKKLPVIVAIRRLFRDQFDTHEPNFEFHPSKSYIIVFQTTLVAAELLRHLWLLRLLAVSASQRVPKREWDC